MTQQQHTEKILLWLLTAPLRTNRDVAQDAVLAHAVAVLVFERAIDGGDGWWVAGFLLCFQRPTISDITLINTFFEHKRFSKRDKGCEERTMQGGIKAA